MPATSHAALFTFDDVPQAVPELADSDDPQTYDYQCGGKAFCSYSDIATLTDGGNHWSDPLSTTRDGVGATISVPGRYFDVWPSGTPDRAVTSGNDPQNFNLFLIDFSVDLAHFEAEISVPHPDTLVEIWIAVELWSDPGATGTLVSSALLTSDDWTYGIANTFAVDAADEQSFRSVRFGWVRSDHPDCRSSCSFGDFLATNRGSFDDLLVLAVPEPRAAPLVAFGAVMLGALKRRSLRAV